jgi:hypothetical protein
MYRGKGSVRRVGGKGRDGERMRKGGKERVEEKKGWIERLSGAKGRDKVGRRKWDRKREGKG